MVESRLGDVEKIFRRRADGKILELRAVGAKLYSPSSEIELRTKEYIDQYAAKAQR